MRPLSHSSFGLRCEDCYCSLLRVLVASVSAEDCILGGSCPASPSHCLCRADVDVITANPKTAGVARWNFFALWGARMDKGEAAALDYVTKARLLPQSHPKIAAFAFRCILHNADMGQQLWQRLPAC